MHSTQEMRPRARSAFAAAFLSLIFPGLGHAYAGAWERALGFAAVPMLLISLIAGLALNLRLELLGFVLGNLALILVLDILLLVYRVVAAIDAYRVTAYLNALEAGGGGRFGPPRLRLHPASVAGLLAVLLVMAGGHLWVAYADVQAQQLVGCVFDGGGEGCDDPSGPDGSPAVTAPADATTSPGSPTPTPGPGTAAPTATAPPWNGKDRLNILLIGADQRPKEGTFNTDTLIVVSIDPTSRQVAMFSLPRDTVDVPLPDGPARSVFGANYRGKINSLWVAAKSRPDLFPGSDRQRGFVALKDTLGELYGLDIRYYVEVNFDGFRRVVDAVGGVTVNVQVPVLDDNYPGDDGRLRRVYVPAGIQHMTGAQALIYARSRHTSTDFDRGQRQQRVLLSLRQQTDVGRLIGRLPELVAALKQAVHTDIPVDQLPPLLRLAGEIDTTNIRSYVFSPPLYGHDSADDPRGYVIIPDVAKMRAAVAAAFEVDPQEEALREKVSQEAAKVWVLNGTGVQGQASRIASYLEFRGIAASAPNQRPDQTGLSLTRIQVFNGAEKRLPATIKLLETVFGAESLIVSDPTVRVDIIVTTGRQTPDLTPPPAP